MQDSENVLATLDPLKSFGRRRLVRCGFVLWMLRSEGRLQPLANLVRLPTLKEIRCPDSPDKQCKLSGRIYF